jgi:L-2,4-diaminobutyric acid acetyltransferase
MTRNTSAISAPANTPATAITLRPPRATDGPALHRLVAASPPLDPNSLYCNLLHCTHFAGTSIAAERNGKLAGFISGYRIPERPQALFVWQVVVAQAARGQGLGLSMLRALLLRPACTGVTELHTSITPDNLPSRALFTALARALDAPLRESTWFERDAHFGGAHADEILLQIGPFPLQAVPGHP